MALISVFEFDANTNPTTNLTGTFIKIEEMIYRVENKIGAGGSATVYLAYDQNNNSFAIKFFRSADDKETAVNEAKFLKALNRLSSPVATYVDPSLVDADGIAQTYFIVVTPYIQNAKTLSEYLTQNPELSAEQRYNLAIKLCLLVGQLHQKDIAHGDMKPANILINSTTLELFLVDFERAAHNIDTVQEHKGTEIYMLPSGANLTRRQADIIALKRCLYLDEKFLTANPGVNTYTPEERDIAIFKTSSTFEARNLLSTRFLAENNHSENFSSLANLQSSAAHLAYELACLANYSIDEKIQLLIFSGLEYKKYKLDPNSYAYYYASHQFDANSKEDAQKIVLQACRIMAHGFTFKVHHTYSNPFFAKAIELVQITDSELKDALYNKNPSQINTYASMYRISAKYTQDTELLTKGLKEAGLYI